MTAVTAEGITANYAYNVQHQRVSKSVGGTTTRFFYGQGGELLSERVVSTGLTAAEYVWLDGKPLAYITNGQVYQVHTDHLGTPQVLTDATGAIAWEAEYRPFGEAITTGNLSFPLRFPGQYHDAETGLHYNWHRYYDPATGRYLTSDPIGLEGGLNPYTYALSNPTAYTDPTGQFVPLLLGVYAAAEVGLSAWDAYDTYQTITNDCASTSEKWTAGGLFAAGVVLPGSYGWVDDAAKGVKGVRNLPFTDNERINEINKTLDRVETSGPFPYKKDASPFRNKEGILPEGSYREYTVDTPGANNRGARRIVIEQKSGKTYYTDDHYRSFIQVNPKKR